MMIALVALLAGLLFVPGPAEGVAGYVPDGLVGAAAGGATGSDAVAHASPAPPPGAVAPGDGLAVSGEGFVFVDDTGRRAGDGALRTYRVEVEPATGVDPVAFTEVAERVLNDERGWTGAGDWALQRVPTRDADIRVVLATPDTVDRLCAQAGLDTHGEVSCFNGWIAALNIDRWNNGADGFPGPLGTYRQYLLNHEVGHGLGHGHVVCPRPGARAPVMQQQTYATRPCTPNGWPTLDPPDGAHDLTRPVRAA